MRTWLHLVCVDRLIVAAAVLIFLVLIGASPTAAQTGTIQFVQASYTTPQTPQASVSVAFPVAQSAGNLNVVIIGWNDGTAVITSVTDATGNIYTRAVGPTVRSNQATQAIYYAKNIGGAATNTVTVTFNVAAAYPDIRILEYSGLDPVNPFHVAAAATGSSSTSSSGSLKTSVPNVLLVAGNVVFTSTRAAGSGFTSRMITSPDGDIAQDRIVSTAGTYSSTAPLTASGFWVMQLVAFKAATGPPPPDNTAPTIAITAPSGTAYTTNTPLLALAGTAADNVGVTLVSWASDRGVSGTATGTTNWSASGIALQAGPNVLTVTARDAAGNTRNAVLTVTYDATPPTVTITAPTSGLAYTTNTSPLTLGGTAADTGSGVTQVSWASDRGGNGNAGGTTSWTAPGIVLQPGANVLTVTARDSAGNSGISTLTVTYTALDTTAPTVAIITPTSGPAYTTNTTPLTLAGTAADNVGVTQVSWASNLGGSGIASGTTSWSATGIALQSGVNVFTVTARDAADKTGVATLTVTYDATPPSVSITAPTDLGTYATGTSSLTLSGTAADSGSGVTQVSWSSDRGGSGIASGTTSWSAGGIALQPGANVLTVTARDGAGNIKTATLTVTYTGPIGLVAAYSFNEGTGNAVGDLSGNNNTGTLNGATWTTQGKFGNALVFNGTNALVTIGDSPSLHLTAGMTLEAWVNPSVVNAAWRDVIYKGNDNYFLEATSTASGGVPGAGGTFGETYATATLAPNTWAHLAVTYDAAILRLYVNGVPVSSLARIGSIPTSTNPLQIGGDSIYGQYFQGSIDEVRIYNRALSQAEIQADMGTQLGTPIPDAQPPTAPGTLTAAAVSTSQVDLNWGVAQDDVGVIGYRVERCTSAGCVNFTEIAAPTGTTYSDTGLTASTTYRYQVRAADAVGNLGAYSNEVSATTPTPDTQPPTAPGTLTATAASGSQVDLSWGAAQDNGSVTGYRLERCQGAGCTDFVKVTVVTGLSYSDTGLTPNTTYSYLVRAADAAGNLGPYSNVAHVTTLTTVPELVAAYSFEEGAGLALLDASGHGNNGTIENASWTTAGKYGKALVFNGTNARVTIPDSASLRLTTGMTLEAWVNPSTVAPAWRDVIYKGNDNYFLEATSATSGGVPGAGGTFGEVYGTAPLTPNVWTHLAVTYDGAALRLYVNGVQVSTVPQTGSIATSTNPLQIGGDSIYGQYFQGTLDEVRIYSLARTPAQIQTDMNTPIGSVSLPLVSLSPASVDFGNQATGTTSDPRTVTLANVGSVALTISSVALVGPHGADFAQLSSCGASLPPGGTCQITVAFTPNATGGRSATITVTDTAPGSPHTVALTGTGTGFSITPRIAVLTRTQVQQFTASSGSVTWSVDGIVGGSAATGTITTTGLYTPPATPGTHTVTATTSNPSQSSNAAVHVSDYAGTFTYRNDNAGTGQNLNETVLTHENVTAATFGKLFSYPLDGVAHTSPLYMADVNIPGRGFHNVVYVATEHNTVYAFDADGLSSSPLWQVSFINPAAGVTTVPANETGECCDITPEIGITGTPVIDPGSRTLYVVAKTKEVVGPSTRYVQRLHALDATTGAEKFGGPVEIQASVPGTGAGAQGGHVPFNPLRANQRPALMLSNGVVYIAFASHGDNQPYHGWVLGYDATTLQQVLAFNATPNGSAGGIWQSNAGPSIDSAGNIYFVTGNGPFDASIRNYGDTIVKINPAGTVVDYFTPANEAILNAGNIDLGSAGVLLIPDQPGSHPHLLVHAGKNGTIYLINRDNMGHHSIDDSQVVQSLLDIFPFGTPEPGNYSAPAYFNGTVYFSPVADAVKAFRLTNGLLPTFQTSQSPQIFPYPGGTLAISANGSTNGILWAVQRNGATAPGALRAYDASNLAIELYNSDQAGSRDTLDVAGKFSVPLVANAKVFVGSVRQLTVYGLLP